MHVLVHPASRPELLEIEDFKSFEVRLAPGVDADALARSLQGIGEPEGRGHVWVLEAWLTGELARQQPASPWRAGFEGMARYARKQGWVRENPRAIRAHVVAA